MNAPAAFLKSRECDAVPAGRAGGWEGGRMGGFKCVKQIKYYTVKDSIMITTSLCGGYFLQSLLEWSGPDQHVGIASVLA